MGTNVNNQAGSATAPDALPTLIQQLEDLLTQLKQIMNGASNDQVFDAAYNEYQGVSSRLQVALSLDIDQQSQEMATAGAALTKAKSTLDAALANVADATVVVNACTKYLGYAEQVLKLAKLAAAVA